MSKDEYRMRVLSCWYLLIQSLQPNTSPTTSNSPRVYKPARISFLKYERFSRVENSLARNIDLLLKKLRKLQLDFLLPLQKSPLWTQARIQLLQKKKKSTEEEPNKAINVTGRLNSCLVWLCKSFFEDLRDASIETRPRPNMQELSMDTREMWMLSENDVKFILQNIHSCLGGL